jgi:hypothetical protein
MKTTNHEVAEPQDTAFLMLISTVDQRSSARLLIDSIRSFGGPFRHAPVWVFEADPQGAPCNDLEETGVRVLPLTVPDAVRHYWFAGKVYACARAEELAVPTVRSLIWFSYDCLIIQPPLLFDLTSSFDAAVRPVHHRNVGLPAAGSVDDFWKGVYGAVGVQDVEVTVESFVDAQLLRAYFNSHAFAMNPAKRLLRRWFECFESLVRDRDFQAGPCQDVQHQVFLHQAVLSTLIATSLDPQRVRILPPEYSYPYNMHQSVPAERRAQALNDLVLIAYEDRTLDPGVVDDILIHEPLRSWLSARR